jgi:hypothetical protein
MFFLMPIFLVVGAIIQPYTPTFGRWACYLGAMVVSWYVFVFLTPQALGIILLAPQYHTPHDLGILLLIVASIALVIWVDVALIRYATSKKH